jgi:hypothetical protein
VGDVPPPHQASIAIAVLVSQVEDRPSFGKGLREPKTSLDRLAWGQILGGARIERL